MSEGWLEQRTNETRVMARSRKQELAAQLQAGHDVSAGELLQIDRLERMLANRDRISRVRARTRSRGGEG